MRSALPMLPEERSDTNGFGLRRVATPIASRFWDRAQPTDRVPFRKSLTRRSHNRLGHFASYVVDCSRVTLLKDLPRLFRRRSERSFMSAQAVENRNVTQQCHSRLFATQNGARALQRQHGDSVCRSIFRSRASRFRDRTPGSLLFARIELRQ